MSNENHKLIEKIPTSEATICIANIQLLTLIVGFLYRLVRTQMILWVGMLKSLCNL